MNLHTLTTAGPSRTVLPCGVEVIRYVGQLDPARPETMRHTVIVAGQHGVESGPVVALSQFREVQASLRRMDVGIISVIRCASPHGFAIASRPDASGRDMNRGWTPEMIGDPSTSQAQIWQALTGDFPVDVYPMLVLDLHSSGPIGPLARSVVTCNGAGSDLAADLADALRSADAVAGIDPRDPVWGVIDLRTDADQTDRERFHPTATLAAWATLVGGIGFTVEFAEHTYRPLPAGYEYDIGTNSNGRREMTIGERVIGVGTLLRWAVDRHR